MSERTAVDRWRAHVKIWEYRGGNTPALALWQYAATLEAKITESMSALQEAYNSMYSEYVDCPWCSGHIGYNDENHDPDCIGNELARNRK